MNGIIVVDEEEFPTGADFDQEQLDQDWFNTEFCDEGGKYQGRIVSRRPSRLQPNFQFDNLRRTNA